MSRQLLINLPVRDLKKSKLFYEKLGLLFNEKLTDKNAICFNIDDNIVLALLAKDRFKPVINNEIADAAKNNEVLLSIGVGSKVEVDTLLVKAVAAGGKQVTKPEDYGLIYGSTFADLDGHQWNIFFVDPSVKSYLP